MCQPLLHFGTHRRNSTVFQNMISITLPEFSGMVHVLTFNGIFSVFVYGLSARLINNIMKGFQGMGVIHICLHILSASFRRIVFHLVEGCHFFIFLPDHFPDVVVQFAK